jgi:hypothetical protein
MKVNSQRHSTAVMALFLMVAAVLACSMGDETEKANKLVDEGNAAVQEFNKLVVGAEETRGKMNSAVSSISNEADLAQARVLAKEAIAAYDKAEDKSKEASKKFEEASKLKIKDKFKEYLTLKMKEFNKRAELLETAKGTPQALIDSDSHSTFTDKAKATNEKIDKLSKEADDLAAQAAKLQKDNPDILKS